MMDINIGFQFIGFQIEFNEQVKGGQILGLSGKSGIGKSSILNAIAGLLTPAYGSIVNEQQVWFDDNINFSPQKRSTSMVFQDYALFPNLSVRQNMSFAQTLNTSEIEEITEVFELRDHLDKKPHQLSGGQQQRVAIARSIIAKPSVLLLDEPFSALDDEIKTKIQQYLSNHIQRYDTKCLIASHDYSDLTRFAHQSVEVKEV